MGGSKLSFVIGALMLVDSIKKDKKVSSEELVQLIQFITSNLGLDVPALEIEDGRIVIDLDNL